MTCAGPSMRRRGSACLALPLLVYAAIAHAQAPSLDLERLRIRLQAKLDSVHAAGKFPGATVGIALPDGSTLALATGMSDTSAKLAMRPTDRMLQGSVGKTYVAAVAMQLVGERKLDLDAKISKYLGSEPWFARLPNAADITVRMLMNHTSGLVRYELREDFHRDLLANPDKKWKPEEEVAYLLDSKAPFPAGEGWDYSDTNYIVLGMIIERITGKPLNGEIERRLLGPLRLRNTVPSDRRTIPGLVQGYAGKDNPFGGFDAMIVDGKFAINPQFEWAGGGWASTADDLARWGKAIYEGKAFPDSLLPQALAGVDAPMLGQGVKYGLGVIIRPNPLGTVYGHAGFFPGYVTDMRYYPSHRIAIAFQVNSSVPMAIGRAPGAVMQDLVAIVIEELGGQS